MEYLLDTYVDKESDFPPAIWAEEAARLTKRTNVCEAFIPYKI